MSAERIIGSIRVGEEPFFEVVDKGDAHVEIRFVYEREHGLRIPKKLVNALTELLRAYDGRRRHPRYSFAEDILLEEGDRVRIRARTTNISQGGVFVETDALLPVGTEVKFKLPPARAKVQGTAKVRVSRQGQGMGLEFGTLRGNSRAHLTKILETCSEHVIG